jgi:hypothetical protein
MERNSLMPRLRDRLKTLTDAPLQLQATGERMGSMLLFVIVATCVGILLNLAILLRMGR